ncbi:gamma-glutamylcyclotransferase [Rhizobium sp. RAF36]|uniref:gamma-glutamylcyclotransferase n=1 Tax=Rhizobium sp. RAF36 TaxID=3233055 RepID=UPI003F94FC5E
MDKHVRGTQHVLSRELLASGHAIALALEDAPDMRLPTATDRMSSLAMFLSSRPCGDLWVFAYGSLIWNPALRAVESRIATIKDWHRSFCLSMTAGRGTPCKPGLALGLDRGGECEGIAYRIAETDVPTELEILWNREMLLGGYRPLWVDVIGADSHRFGSALTFVIDRQHHHFTGEMSILERVERLATASGSWGSSADYLFETAKALRVHGIPDAELEGLAKLVANARRATNSVGID